MCTDEANPIQASRYAGRWFVDLSRGPSTGAESYALRPRPFCKRYSVSTHSSIMGSDTNVRTRYIRPSVERQTEHFTHYRQNSSILGPRTTAGTVF